MTNKKIVIYGNCQLGAIYRVLKDKYVGKYDITMITNFKLIWEKKMIPNDFLFADILIYQPLYSHGIYNTENIINNMCKNDCQKISISYLFFTGYYPDYFKNNIDNAKTISQKLPYGLFPYGMKSLTDQKYELPSKIIENSKTHDFIEKSLITHQLQRSLEKLYEKEQYVDIKCADYISENYKKIKLFHTVDHPTNILLQKIIDDITILLNEQKIELLQYDELLKDVSIPIYPCVYDTLQLKFENLSFYSNEKSLKYDDWIYKYINVLYK